MKNNTLRYLAALLLNPCAMAQVSLQQIDQPASGQASVNLEFQDLSADAAAAEFESFALQNQPGANKGEFNQITLSANSKELELKIANLRNRLAELNAASRQQQEILKVDIQKLIEAQNEAQRAAKSQAWASGHFGSGAGGRVDRGLGGFAYSIDSVAPSPNWIIGVQVQSLGEQGLKVLSLSEGLPAKAAGLKKEDIILSANGLKLKTSEALRNLIQAAENQQLEFLIKRGDDAATKIRIAPQKNQGTMLSPRPVPRIAFDDSFSTGLAPTPLPAKRQSDARLKKNLDQHPELKKLLNDYFEKRQKKDE